MLTRIFSFAYHCLRDWLLQRITAAIMAIYSVMWLVIIAIQPMNEFSAWQSLFAHYWMKLASLLFIVSLLYHAWLGIRDISMDYIPALALRKAFQVLVVASLLAYSCWSMFILWSI